MSAEGRAIGREIHCVCYSQDDHITVVRTGDGPPISDDLSNDADFDNAVWLFDTGNQGRNQLAIVFHRSDGQLVADLYQDQDGDRVVAIEWRDGRPVVTEPGFWSVRVIALDGYWQRDGRLAPNLDLIVDDRLIGTFGGELFEQVLRNDGQPDLHIRVRGPNRDDPRSYDWRNVVSPGVTPSMGVYRTTLMVRERGQEPGFAPIFPWYLLGATYGPVTGQRFEGGTQPLVGSEGRVFGIVKPYGGSFPPIQVIWNTFIPKIAVIGEFVASRGADTNWFTYSIARVEPGATTSPDFESPFAFYDLAEDGDSVPELSVRVTRFSGNGPFGYVRELSRGYQHIRYSWDQANEQTWTHKLSLIAEHSIDSEDSFSDFKLKTIPYEELPGWVTTNPWQLATFVVAEDNATWTTEGIYEGDHALEDLYYFAGLRDEFSGAIDRAELLARGQRGDYNRHLAAKPQLTFNPVDRQLHLYGAEGGVWNVDGRREIRYLTLDGGPTHDGWRALDGGRLVAQLYRVPGGLLYSDDTGTFYREVDLPDEVFRASPPTNNDEWVRLGERLRAERGESPPGDLRAWFDQVGGELQQIAASPLEDLRLTDDGARFVVRGDDRSNPDPQVVSLVGGEWNLETVAFANPTVDLAVEEARALEGTSIQVTVENPSSLDFADAYLVTGLRQPDGTLVNLERREVAIDAHGTETFDIAWLPTEDRAWEIEASVYRLPTDPYAAARNGQDVLLAQGGETFQVAAAAPITEARIMGIGWPGALSARLLVVASLVLAAGSAIGLGLRPGGAAS